MKRYDVRPVCPSVRPSVPIARYTSVRRVCCCGLAGQEMSIDACTSCVRFSVSVAVSRTPAYAVRARCHIALGPDLQNIIRQSYDCLTIMPKLRSTYDGRLIYRTSYEECSASLR